MDLIHGKGTITLRTWRDGVCTGEQVADNIMCSAGLGNLAGAVAWSGAQDQGSLIGAQAEYLTPLYGAVGTGTLPPFQITGSISNGSTLITNVLPAESVMTGSVVSGSNVVTVASTTGVYQGMLVTDSSGYIPGGTTVLSTTSTTITLSANASNTNATDTLTMYYPIVAGQQLDAVSGISAYTGISSYSPSTNTITMTKAAVASTLSTPAAVTAAATGTTTATSTSFTPVVGEMLLVAVGSYNAGTASLSISDTVGGLTWTKIQGNNGTSNAAPAIFWAIATSATSGTVTVTNTGTSTLVIQVFSVQGQGSSPIVQTINTTGPVASFSSAPLNASVVFALIEDATTGTAPVFTAPNGFTALGTTSNGRVYTSAAAMAGPAYQNVTWIETNAVGAALLAIEISSGSGLSVYVGTSATDSALYNEFGRTQVTAVSAAPSGVSGPQTVFDFQFDSNTANQTITEAGVFTLASDAAGSGELLDHAMFMPAFTWPANDTMTMTLTITWSAPS